jgi:hypothetical protein
MAHPLLSKEDMKNYVQFSDNIADRIFNFHYHNAIEYDIKPRLGESLYNACILATQQDFPELFLFRDTFVSRYAALATYVRLITEHGTNVTQFGFTQLRDPAGTFDQASEERRAVFLRAYKSDMDTAFTLLNNEMKRVNYTFDGIVFDSGEVKEKRSIGISAIRKKQNRY